MANLPSPGFILESFLLTVLTMAWMPGWWEAPGLWKPGNGRVEEKAVGCVCVCEPSLTGLKLGGCGSRPQKDNVRRRKRSVRPGPEGSTFGRAGGGQVPPPNRVTGRCGKLETQCDTEVS